MEGGGPRLPPRGLPVGVEPLETHRPEGVGEGAFHVKNVTHVTPREGNPHTRPAPPPRRIRPPPPTSPAPVNVSLKRRVCPPALPTFSGVALSLSRPRNPPRTPLRGAVRPGGAPRRPRTRSEGGDRSRAFAVRGGAVVSGRGGTGGDARGDGPAPGDTEGKGGHRRRSHPRLPGQAQAVSAPPGPSPPERPTARTAGTRVRGPTRVDQRPVSVPEAPRPPAGRRQEGLVVRLSSTY